MSGRSALVGTALLGAALALCGASRSEAGAYALTALCGSGGCVAGNLKSTPGIVQPFGVVYPYGYVRTGGTIEVRICVASPELLAPTQRAVAAWNALTPTVNNCKVIDNPLTEWVDGCYRWDDSFFPPATKFYSETLILHELGHCAFALDHPERPVEVADTGVYTESSFSRSHGEIGTAGSISSGADSIPGSRDDWHSAGLGGLPADSVVWSRKVDNDPFKIDSTVIESTTFSRSVTSGLPTGHSWRANGNRVVGETLGYTDTVAVMYGGFSSYERLFGLSADDVNMLKMGMTGEDQLAGTSDDYSVHLSIVTSCAEPHEIYVSFAAFSEQDADVVGKCRNQKVDYTFPPPNPLLMKSYIIVKDDTAFPFTVLLNSAFEWDHIDVTLVEVTADGFETGTIDPTQWSSWTP